MFINRLSLKGFVSCISRDCSRVILCEWHHVQIAPKCVGKIFLNDRIPGNWRLMKQLVHPDIPSISSKPSQTWEQMGVSKNRGTPNGWFIMENPIKMDDLGVPWFSETSRSNISIADRTQEPRFRRWFYGSSFLSERDSHGLNLAGLRQGLVPLLGRVNGSTPPPKELNLDEFGFVNDLWQPQNHFHLDSMTALERLWHQWHQLVVKVVIKSQLACLVHLDKLEWHITTPQPHLTLGLKGSLRYSPHFSQGFKPPSMGNRFSSSKGQNSNGSSSMVVWGLWHVMAWVMACYGML